MHMINHSVVDVACTIQFGKPRGHLSLIYDEALGQRVTVWSNGVLRAITPRGKRYGKPL